MITKSFQHTNPNDRVYYRRHLPHYQPLNATFFVTFRLAGSLPAAVIEKMRVDRERVKNHIEDINNRKIPSDEWYKFINNYFAPFEGLLDRNEKGPLWLRDPRIAGIVKESIHHRDRKEYDLIAYCIMPNHVHMVFTVGRLAVQSDSPQPRPTSNANVLGADCLQYIVTKIMKGLKWYTALESNKLLNRTGAFWQHESYDHVIRDDDELSRIVEYVLMNPVHARLIDSIEEWPWTYLKDYRHPLD